KTSAAKKKPFYDFHTSSDFFIEFFETLFKSLFVPMTRVPFSLHIILSSLKYMMFLYCYVTQPLCYFFH
uniref:Uncharacterized protein n=1 Tax=Aegilops tauschii subsp. strangulata TaxID=200361 RepID=A0A453LDQ0_AEGTS